MGMFLPPQLHSKYTRHCYTCTEKSTHPKVKLGSNYWSYVK
ncbi:hypothetical protein VAE122_2400003 [Vibrio aestuarianus]|nr:hypothetical protein VAE122_2400003 [Vibrio aestuarianus]